MPPLSDFNGAIAGRNVIVGSHFETGATMNNYFGGYPIMHGSRKRVPFSTIPFAPDRDFVDRPEILEWIHDKCVGPGARAALVGLGGVGKSQLAIRYSYDVRDASLQTYVFWVHASTRARFEEAYRHIADRLELPRRDDPNVDVLQLVRNWLCDETNGQWMMIVDNADDIEVFYLKQTRTGDESSPPAPTPLATYLPQSRNGSILITSRSKDAAARLAGGYRNIKEVFAMDETQALDLFRNKLGCASDEEGAVDLLRALDYIPLAITQAAAFINRRGRMTASGYLDEFQRNDKKRKSLLNWDSGDLRRDESASNSVVLTWQISFEHIHEQRRSAAELLSLMSFFNPQGIPEWILRRHSKSVAKAGDEDEADNAFDEDLGTLQSYSLITATADRDVCEMHALVQFCTRVWLSSFSDAKRWKQKFLGLMARESPQADFKNWVKCRQLLPHVVCLYESELPSDEAVKKWALMLNNAAWYMQTGLGKYDEAEKLNRRVLEGCEKELGVQHLVTLTSVSNLALVLQYQGKYDEAEKLNQRALEGSEKELGVQHPDTVTSVNNLAIVLQYQGKYNEAEKLYQRALKGCEKELGKKHPDTLTSVSNLAMVLRFQGRYDEAEKLNRQALEGREKELGKKHPDTLTSVSNLAMVLRYQGRYDEAEKLNRQVLEGCEKELGVQHPDTLTSVSNLAVVLRDQGKYNEAEKLNRRAVEEREKELGVQHPDTLNSIYGLACLLDKQKRYTEASELYQRACDGYKQKLGSQHPTAIKCLNDFTAMQQEAEEEGLRRSRTFNNNHKAALG
ncbi:uncharacterized protein BHQ10_009464 [Talaromyces amestolkiae]|uniref:DUF7779 domain-containing protein n=1 Tax=Talaromyces amestolkiae TaxID=1196081 RepID=A0A364LCD5_TALAM|nr:uncharacterized protein BHQ10_009464 [Talaromyces amestolkiae]RAO73452.1 hypothetical protein BHQ10_009464 [Talaromyces amestolkiae]